MLEDKFKSPLSKTAKYLWNPWSMLILRELMIFDGRRRFDELRESLGISRNVLTDRLKEMVKNEVLAKVLIEKNGKRMAYELTPKGWELRVTMLSLHQWSMRWYDGPDDYQISYVDDVNHEVIPEIDIKAADGRTLDPSTLLTVPKNAPIKHYLEKFKNKDKKDEKE